MIKTIIKFILKILIILSIICCINIPTSYAGFFDEFITTGDDFLSTGKQEFEANTPMNEQALKNTSNKIYNVLLAMGIVIAVIVGGIIGIQFMIGSVEQKVKIKEALVPYVIGCIVIFGAFGIWKIVVGIGNNITTSATYTKSQDGSTLWCGNCYKELLPIEQDRAICSDCGKTIQGL